MSIDVQLVKKLREETGAGVLEAKETLVEANGDYDEGVRPPLGWQHRVRVQQRRVRLGHTRERFHGAYAPESVTAVVLRQIA